MLLTLRTTYRPATDLGFLLHKHPEHIHTREFPFGNATVFYPESTEDSCTARKQIGAIEEQLTAREEVFELLETHEPPDGCIWIRRLNPYGEERRWHSGCSARPAHQQSASQY